VGQPQQLIFDLDQLTLFLSKRLGLSPEQIPAFGARLRDLYCVLTRLSKKDKTCSDLHKLGDSGMFELVAKWGPSTLLGLPFAHRYREAV
jgi:hypothetical protein